MLDSAELLKNAFNILKDKKAKDIEVIDIRELTTITDYFVICSGTSSRHIKSLTDELEQGLNDIGVMELSKEGYSTANWVLVDMGMWWFTYSSRNLGLI